MKPIITRQMLVDAGACKRQLAEFDRLFPSGSVVVTVARAKKLASVFDWHWARRFLDRAAQADYERVRAAAWADYDRVEAAALADCERATDAALADYERATDAALADYERATDAARTDYKRATAPAWARAYIDTCKRKGVA